MRKIVVNALLILSMVIGTGVFTINAQASQNDPLYVTVNSVDLSDVMDMKVIDSSGKSVRLRDLVAENKVTLLNFWGTFCGPCTTEMPILDQLSKKYADQGFKVIGLCVDVADQKGKLDQEELELAQEIVADTGVTYPIVFPMPKMKESLKLMSYPTSFFVDSKGNAIKDGIFGARDSSKWDKEISECLKKVDK